MVYESRHLVEIGSLDLIDDETTDGNPLKPGDWTYPGTRRREVHAHSYYLQRKPSSAHFAMPANPPRLPLETWNRVLGYLSFNEQKRCLPVSRLTRAVALRLLFAMTHVYLGAWETLNPGLNDRYLTPNLDGIAYTHAREILERIATDKDFAEGIRTLVVHGYAKPGKNSTQEIGGCSHTSCMG
jgi:hypothetical protein